jgi:hypothetical protein
MRHKKTLITLSLGTVGYFSIDHYRNNMLYRGANRRVSSQDDSAKIIVRVWHPYPKDPIGHVSLQVGEDYLSFWPEKAIDKWLAPSSTATLQTLAEDINAESHRQPDETFEFKYLDRTIMQNEIRKIKTQIADNTIGYSLIDRKLHRTLNCKNCATLVFNIMTAGGLETFPILDHFINSPQQLRDILAPAARIEMRDASLTKSMN